jgi:hypothetical protein
VTGTSLSSTVIDHGWYCRLKGAVNMTALLEYKKKDEEFRSRLDELEDVTTQRNNARKEYEDLRRLGPTSSLSVSLLSVSLLSR